MDLSAVPTETLRLWQADALQAQHALMTGRREVSMSIGTPGTSRSVTYTQANLGDLRSYLAQLAAEIAKRGGAQVTRRRAIGVRF